MPKSISDNLFFLSAEVESQVANLQTCLTTDSAAESMRILQRSGYARNLKLRIHNSCFDHIARSNAEDIDSQSFRSIESIATNLEYIAKLCRDCIQQWVALQNKAYLKRKDYKPLLKRVTWGVSLVDRAIVENDTRLALKISRVESKLDHAYEKLVRKYTAKSNSYESTENIIPLLFIAYNVGQMGTALLGIREAIISVTLGQPVNINRYHSLQASLEKLPNTSMQKNMVFEPAAETRSGTAVSGIAEANQADGYTAIFKDGEKSKLKEERQGVESWHDIFPGVAPKILSYQKRGESAALLIEHLAGSTFENILLHQPRSLLKEALGQLGNTLESVWRETRSEKPAPAGFMRQLDKSLGEVCAIHPEFSQGSNRICDDVVQAVGIPKQPRVNPGTIVHNRRLHGLIPRNRRELLLRLPRDEL